MAGGTEGGAVTPPRLVIDDPDIMALYTYWADKCHGRKMPCRADIHPEEFVWLLPQVFVMDILQPLRFRFRLVGTNICERWDQDLTGEWLDEIDHDGVLEVTLEQYASVARTGIPRFDTEEFVNDAERYLHYHRLLLPLSEDGQSPNMLLGVQKAIGIDGYFLGRQVSVHRWL